MSLYAEYGINVNPQRCRDYLFVAGASFVTASWTISITLNNRAWGQNQRSVHADEVATYRTVGYLRVSTFEEISGCVQ